MEDDEFIPRCGIAVGFRTWQLALDWAEEFGPTWDYGVSYFAGKKPEDLAVVLAALQYVYQSLEHKERTAEEQRIYDTCLGIVVELL